jgi:hypothetical protein
MRIVAVLAGIILVLLSIVGYCVFTTRDLGLTTFHASTIGDTLVVTMKNGQVHQWVNRPDREYIPRQVGRQLVVEQHSADIGYRGIVLRCDTATVVRVK